MRGSNRQSSPAWVIARTDLRQLRQARDFWLPLSIVALLFFVIIPAFLLLIIGSVKDANLAKKLSDVVGSLPKDLQAHVHGKKGPVSASYALAVYLFAPLAIIVPLTVSSAVGAHTIIGERERGSGEFLAHSPATERQIYLGKLMASLIPGYFTAAMGFGMYSLVVNLIVGPKLGGWFFPTTNWWILVLWVLPPFIALALRGDPRDLGAGVERGRRAAGIGAGDAAADRDRVRRVEQHALPGPRSRLHHRRRCVGRGRLRPVARVEGRLARTPPRHGHRLTPRSRPFWRQYSVKCAPVLTPKR